MEIKMTEDQKRIAQLENQVDELRSQLTTVAQAASILTEVVDKNTSLIKITAKGARLGLESLKSLLDIHVAEHTPLK